MNIEALQRAICLAIAVPDTVMTLTCRSGDSLCATDGGTGDLSILQLRRATLAALDPELTDCSRWIGGVELGGSLEATDNGLHKCTDRELPEFWFATLEPPRTAARQFRSLNGPEYAGTLVSIHPDRLLGAAAVRVRTRNPATDLHAAASALHRSLLPHSTERALAS